ncbi:MAG: hypothetical protein NC321_07415 [Clostridium sp.]|nr:hypothetical protein [Clostridium sp.]
MPILDQMCVWGENHRN